MSAIAERNGRGGVPILERLKQEAEELRAGLEELDQQRIELVGEHAIKLAELDHTRTRIRRVLKALGEEAPEPTPRRKAPSRRSIKRGQISLTLADEIVNDIRKLVQRGEERVTALGVIEMRGAAPGQRGQIYAVFSYLREIQFLDWAGKDPVTKRQLFRIGNDNAFEQVKEELNAY